MTKCNMKGVTCGDRLTLETKHQVRLTYLEKKLKADRAVIVQTVH